MHEFIDKWVPHSPTLVSYCSCCMACLNHAFDHLHVKFAAEITTQFNCQIVSVCMLKRMLLDVYIGTGGNMAGA